MAKSQKFYAVRKGKTTGIFLSWPECQAAIDGYPHAVFKSFSSNEEAEAFVRGENLPQINHTITDKNTAIVYTDGSFNIQHGTCGYGCIIITSEGETELFGKAHCSPDDMLNMRQIPGEIEAVKEAVIYCQKHGIRHLIIYHDYTGVAQWALGHWRANNPITRSYQEFMSNIDLDITFEKVDAHTNNFYNEKADAAAKKGCLI
jgi:ribonuclease HI